MTEDRFPRTELRCLLTEERGAVTVNWVVLSAAAIGLAVAASGLVVRGVGATAHALGGHLENDGTFFESRHLGKSPAEVAAAVDLTYHDDRWARRRFARLMDGLTEAQLRNQQRTWRRRAADPGHARHAEAGDHLAMLDIAMRARGVDPHP